MLEAVSLGLVTTDLPGTLRLYSETFGYRNGGATCLWGGMSAKIQGLGEDQRMLMWWLMGSRKVFNLELFQYTHPLPQLLPSDWRPSDIGWTRFGVLVPNFDASLRGLKNNGVTPFTSVIVKAGRRRVAFRDPYIGAIVEIMESDPKKPEGPLIAYMTTSVSDLEKARSFYGDTLELELLPLEQLHSPSDEALWGLPGAERDGFLALIDGLLLEIVQYRNPVPRPKPANYKVSDQGIMNLAIITKELAPIMRTIERVKAAGYTPPYLFNDGKIAVCYITDPERSLEFGVVPENMRDAARGFAQDAFDFMGGGVGLREQA